MEAEDNFSPESYGNPGPALSPQANMANLDSSRPRDQVLLNIPPLNIQVEQFNQFQTLNNVPPASNVPSHVICQYCNEQFPANVISEHIEGCELRKIWCQACGERVLIDVFDVHLEECNPEDENSEQDESMENGEHHPRHNSMFLPESHMTYEQLLLLDNTIVKKGLTPEQLKAFRVFLYVKSLDGVGFCNICMSNYETGEYIRELSCHHKFHQPCVDTWLEANITCPTCKKYLR